MTRARIYISFAVLLLLAAAFPILAEPPPRPDRKFRGNTQLDTISVVDTSTLGGTVEFGSSITLGGAAGAVGEVPTVASDGSLEWGAGGGATPTLQAVMTTGGTTDVAMDLQGTLALGNAVTVAAADPGTAAQVLTSAGAGSPPTWETPAATVSLVDIRAYATSLVAPVNSTSAGLTLDTRGTGDAPFHVSDADADTREGSYVRFIMPDNYDPSSDFTVTFGVSFTSATSGDARLFCAIMRVVYDSTDLDSGDSFDTEQVVLVTAPGTSGQVTVSSDLTFSNAAADDVEPGDIFVLFIGRDAAAGGVSADDATGDAEIHWVRVLQ